MQHMKQVAVDADVHKAAKVKAAERGLKLGDFATDALSAHILRLTPAEEEQAIQHQKRGSRRGSKISKK